MGLHRSLLICDKIYLCVINGESTAALLTKQQKKFMQQMGMFPSVLRTEYALALAAKDTPKIDKLAIKFAKYAAQCPYPCEIEGESELMKMAKSSCDKTVC